uniref:helix-turn-helix domain-containing protein n=1 Tax=Parerythrobacter lutipelagi TaxID=1964208 RepID=UPI0010FA3DD4|nr:helix-turn-helix domain-containing protein [Parerythrobacter lutipelagi]
MSDTAEQLEEELPLERAGDRLRHARESQEKSLDAIAEETRIPLRHLQTIEAGDWAELPSRTYAVGFSRTYARALGLDDDAILEMVRAELAEGGGRQSDSTSSFEPGDPARIPGRGLAWFSAAAALILIIGLIAFFGDRVFPGAGPGSILPDEQTAEQAASSDAAATPAEVASSTGGQAGGPANRAVIFTALDDNVWVRFTDADGSRLLEKQLTKGETFTIPADAVDPRINTGRPDLLAITIGGQNVAKLAEEPVTIGDAQVSAQALRDRSESPANAAE